ncbi:hypothetical protein HIV01_011970 [Lysobacter arenosi]|uniref:DUF2946 domain-containing protein n=1 Tax=Lysobacter arenosi TaxID=2795387 RepID=A0ABX7R953_9GAMM|nr:hypothetical protein [Lysobacter arenosi]QSX73937.1 hypothetical protein HIV01_011970 [Lysobacter arenosi]
MSASSALHAAVRLLLLGLLLASFTLKPALAFAEEVHELVAHAAAGSHGHGHEFGEHDVDDHAPAPDDGKSGHDDDHWHLTHCCGQQAAMLPRMQFDLPTTVAASPVATLSVAFAPTRLTAPFRPPIAV